MTCFPSGSWAFGPFRQGGISGDAGVQSRARLQQRRCRQSDLPGTPRRIRATSAGTGREATWGDASYSGFTSQEHEYGSGEPWENAGCGFEHMKMKGSDNTADYEGI